MEKSGDWISQGLSRKCARVRRRRGSLSGSSTWRSFWSKKKNVIDESTQNGFVAPLFPHRIALFGATRTIPVKKWIFHPRWNILVRILKGFCVFRGPKAMEWDDLCAQRLHVNFLSFLHSERSSHPPDIVNLIRLRIIYCRGWLALEGRRYIFLLLASSIIWLVYEKKGSSDFFFSY